MKENRFRIWNKSKKRWSQYGINLLGEIIVMGYITTDTNDNTSISIKDLNDLIVSQYIGRKDKNNKEIYEGDIVKIPAGFNGDGYYIECLAVIKYEAPDIIAESITDRHGVVWQNFNYEDTIVIGNIFENPELQIKNKKIREMYNDK